MSQRIFCDPSKSFKMFFRHPQRRPEYEILQCSGMCSLLISIPTLPRYEMRLIYFSKNQVVYLLVCLDSDQRIPRISKDGFPYLIHSGFSQQLQCFLCWKEHWQQFQLELGHWFPALKWLIKAGHQMGVRHGGMAFGTRGMSRLAMRSSDFILVTKRQMRRRRC